MIGKTISHYKILEKLGEGGMGVVYKAQDTKLDREVALKFLPTHTVSTKEEKIRFQQEAKAAAKLSHANIATVHAIDEVDGQAFIAMEYVDGETLSEKIERGPLKLEEAIKIVTQVAEGLRAAHDKKITHRDIKSANIMLSSLDEVKIMDFGLAKLSGRTMVTKEGTTLGTASYMSPEQARGEPADNRSDIWSLGVIFYEMISGQLPFKGDYEQAVIYGILNENPEPLTAIRTGVPIALDGIIAKALAKDPNTRYQNVEEMPSDLKAIDTATLSQSRIATNPSMTMPVKSASSLKMSWALTGLMALLALSALWYGWRANTNSSDVAKVKRVILPLTPSDGLDGRFAISPDGTMLVFEGFSAARNQLFLRHLNEDQAVPLAGTEGGSAPFFSPDSKWIGFRTGTKLKKLSVEGGSPFEICDAFVQDASWSDQDEIIFSQLVRTARHWQLMRVPASGGIPEPLPTDESKARRQGVRWPHVLPGGRHVLLTSGPGDNASIEIRSIDSDDTRSLILQGINPHYVSSGHIIFIRAENLMAIPFDLASLTVTGPGSPLAEDVYTGLDAFESYTVSKEGTLIYRSEEANRGRGLVWFDRQGRSTPVGASENVYWDPRLSPDGRRVAFNRPGEDIWTYELARGALTRLTHDPGVEETPYWSPTGRWIAYASSETDQPSTVARVRADGSDVKESLWTSDDHVHVECWSSDGRSIIVTNRDPNTLDDLWLLSLDDEITARPLLQTQFVEFGARISPDGKWFAYTSDESEGNQVYVQAFPALGQKTQISINGGSQPVWSPDGKELFYRDGVNVMVVTIVPNAKFTVTSPKQLFFDQHSLRVGRHTPYDVSKDGKRFLMIQSDAQGRTSLNVVFNWFEEVKRLAPNGN